MRVRYTPRSRGDLADIYRYIEQSSPSGARAVIQTIQRQIRLLAFVPFMAPETTEPGVYELSVARYPYKVYYRVEDNEVRIVHVRHTSRRPPKVGEL